MSVQPAEQAFSLHGGSIPGVVRLLHVAGDAGKFNDIVHYPTWENAAGIVVFFPGDVQDYPEVMTQHRDNKRYLEWNVDATTQLLHQRFPHHSIFLVKPSSMHLGTFSCFGNFVESDAIGNPKHSFGTKCFHHLAVLLQNAVKMAARHRESKENCSLDRRPPVSCTATESQQCTLPAAEPVAVSSTESGTGTCQESLPLTLVGFSKGCVVLNQLLHELEDARQCHTLGHFLPMLKAMYWLDGGHNGGSKTWVTERPLLEAICKSDIEVHVHVTPYQVNDLCRPWIGKEERMFHTRLRAFGKKVNRQLHFEDDGCNLENHFGVLHEF